MIRIILALFICVACSSDKKGLVVVATPVPHAEMLEFIQKELEESGTPLTIVVSDDYNLPNRALAGGEADANFFQHQPFLDADLEAHSYPLISFAQVEIEPLGFYSKKIKSLSELKEGSTLAIANDPSNEARALLLLAREGLIKIDNSKNLHATPLNITENPKKLKFIEVDAAMLPRTLEDVDGAVINTNYALEAGLSPLKDALFLEDKDSPYVNVLVIRKGEENREDLKALKKALTSEKMRAFILNRYQGALIPAF